MGHAHQHHQRHDRAHDERGGGEGERQALRVRTTVESGQAANHLMSLAQVVRAGGGTLRSGGQTVVVRVGETVDVEIQAGEEGGQSVVRMALRWRTLVPQADLEITPGLRASVAQSEALAGPAGSVAQAHEMGLVLPGDPPSPAGAPSPLPASPAPPDIQGGRRGRQSAQDRTPEA